ncbi:hypothetical protein E4U43_000741 [Claviceps pusilla]|uniref:Cell cycle control protein cwf19 n=1 Tax=Claviceps pusilla TaxID=123648 RepID=A0A9P7T0X1_9HYPO|nr:hypothetical protein E4U43_000741 [Claviceps pusilla]
MDGLDAFEKALAAEKAERDKSCQDDRERRRHKHRHSHGDGKSGEESHRHRHHDQDGRSHKRSRHSHQHGDDEHQSRDRHRHRHRHHRRRDDDQQSRGAQRHSDMDANEDLGGEQERSDTPVRDAWMVGPSALGVEHLSRAEPKANTPPVQEPKRVIHARELNQGHLQKLNDGILPPSDVPLQRATQTVDYTFGDAGSSWRMTRLRGVYTTAEDSGRPIDEVAVERYGSLREFDHAREEQEELERRRLYGSGYREKETPTGELYLAREQEQRREKSRSSVSPSRHSKLEPGPGIVVHEQTTPMDPTSLNRLRAQMMKAKLRRAPDAARLEQEYNRAAALASSSSQNAPQAVVLGTMHNRQLAGSRGEVQPLDTKRGRERGLVQENTDMTIEDMLREERRTKNAPGGEALRLAERIAKDGAFDNDLDYMDENASKLAQRVHKSELNLKNMAVAQFQRLNRVLDSCPLCYHEEQNRPPIAPVVSLATRVFLTLPPEPEISPGGAIIVPLSHRVNLLECDDDEWEEIRNFMKSLTRMYHQQGREVVFYENAAAPNRHLHAAMVAVPIPYSEGATAPAYFKEAFLSSDEEWAQHKKIIDTGAAARGGMGRMAFRRSLAKEMPYFHVWFTLDGGLGHIVEDSDRWPRGDLFAREVLGGIVDAEPGVAKKQGRWVRGDQRVEGWKKGWRKFDWTRVLEET